MPKLRPNVDTWLKKMTPEQWEALHRAAKIFPKESQYDLHTLEGMYGQESSWGSLPMGKPGTKGFAGPFQLSLDVAHAYGLKVLKENDERFNFDKASECAAKYLNSLDSSLAKKTVVIDNIVTIPIKDPEERAKFALASYNTGLRKIAEAQQKAKEAGKDPTKWDDVREFLKAVGINDPKTLKEKYEYPEKVLNYSQEFRKKSQRDGLPLGWHWITKDGRHILIREKLP